MSDRSTYPLISGLKRFVQGNKTYLGYGVSLAHGFGWFCQVYEFSKGKPTGRFGFGFHGNNRFTAYRNAHSKMINSKYL